jgi:lipid-A-disaccharide synthase
MLAAASRLRLVELDLDVVIPHARAELAEAIAACVERAGATSWVRLEHGELGATLSRARAALSVSGTVLIDLLHQRVPAVVVYRLRSRLAAALALTALVVPWFSAVNLLAARTVYPEYCFRGAGPFEEVCAALTRCYKDEAWRATCAEGLEEAARRLGPPGATARAARHALALVSSRHA